MLLLGPGLLTAWSVVLGRVHEATQGNLLMSVLMHASISSSALVFGQRYADRGDELAWTLCGVALAMSAAAVFWRALRRPGVAATQRRVRAARDTAARAIAQRGDVMWDAIVVGSGIGGLAAAAALARRGRRVLVLEQHHVAGG